MYLLATGSVIMACNTELEIAIGHCPTNFYHLAEQIQFATPYLLYISNGEAIYSL